MADPELNDTDRTVLGELVGGRNVPKNLADEAGKSRQYIHQRLKILEAADYVENIGNGVYELHPEELPDDVAADLGADHPADVDAQEAAKLKTEIEALEASRAEVVDERDELRERVEELEEQLRGDAVDVDRVQTALDDAETAAELGDGQALREAIQRAREVLDDAE